MAAIPLATGAALRVAFAGTPEFAAVALQAIPAFKPAVEDRAGVLQGPLFSVHVLSLLFAYVCVPLTE